MAHFIPETFDTSKRPPSEQAVFEAIQRHLSDDWIVFHSFTYIARDQASKVWDREIDFLLYHPFKGFLVIEVKGGSISYQNGQWYQDNQPIDPVEQAKRNKYTLMEFLQKKLNRPIPLRFAHAVCFPSCDKNATVWPADAQGIVITKDQLKNIEEIATNLIEEAPLPQGLNIAHLDTDDVLNALSPEFEYPQSLRERIVDDDHQFTLLSQQQCTLLEALQNFPRLHFRGGAGTGKTLLALKKARMVAATGGTVLLLCFNELLAKKLSKAAGYQSGIHARAFFDFCIEVMGIPQEEYARHKEKPTLYSEILPNLLEKFLKDHPIQYDAIIVDEGQDFTPQIWSILPRLLRPNGTFYIFYDPDQNIFCDQLNIPDFGLPPIALTRNYRNTQKIFDALTPYRSIPMQPMEHCPIGQDVVVRTGDCRQLLQEEIERIYATEKIPQTSLVVLGGHSLPNTSVGQDPQLGKYRIVEQPVHLESKEVPYYTYMKFKGCEAKIVILLDVDEADPRWNNYGMYTAMSRAMHQLIILKKG